MSQGIDLLLCRIFESIVKFLLRWPGSAIVGWDVIFVGGEDTAANILFFCVVKLAVHSVG